MDHLTASPHGSSSDVGTCLNSFRDEEHDAYPLLGSEAGPNTPVLPHGPHDYDPDKVQRRGFPARSSQGNNVSRIVRDAGHSLHYPDFVDNIVPENTLDLIRSDTRSSPRPADSSQHSQTSLQSHEQYYLSTLLRLKMIPSKERGGAQFIPRNELESAMTPQNVNQALLTAGVEGELGQFTDSICRRGRESRQRIFALLCMLSLPGEITKFTLSRIFDYDLPFTFQYESYDTNGGVYRVATSGSINPQKRLEFFSFKPWTPILCELFRNSQSQVLAPVFRFSWAPGDQVSHYFLTNQQEFVLPFVNIDDTFEEVDLSVTTRRYGGTSIVRKINIHPAHYNACPIPGYQEVRTVRRPDSKSSRRGPDFAVKELDVNHGTKICNGNNDDRETLALKRFNDKHDPHLIRLLLTYSYDGRFHMVFPWADGNLKVLWKKHLNQPRQEVDLLRWMSTQILGLAQALSWVHYCEIDGENLQGLSSEDRKRPHGRHGDLKPENILWFKDEGSSMGTLKIADFGFADFHSEHSKSDVCTSDVDGITATYRAPEYDVKKRVSPQYDIWSFGCVLLEFVAWYLQGWVGVDDFSKQRLSGVKGSPIASDVFFAREYDVTRGWIASTKGSVKQKCDKLKQHCSDYVLDLLEYIQTCLLRVDPINRAKVVDIVRELQNMNDACQRDVNYCISRTPGRSPRMIDTDPEFLSVSGPPIGDLATDERDVLPTNRMEELSSEAPDLAGITAEEASADLEARHSPENITNDVPGPQVETHKAHMTSIDRLRERFRKYKQNMHRRGLQIVNLCCGDD